MQGVDGNDGRAEGIVNRRLVFCPTLLSEFTTGELITHCVEYCGRFFAVCCPHRGNAETCHGFGLVFTDGACLSNGHSGATAGIGVAIGVSGVDQWSIPVDDTVDAFPRRSSQRAELLAAIEGLRIISYQDGACVDASDKRNIRNNVKHRTAWIITTDSEYVVKGITEWFPTWKANGWRGSNGRRPANLDLFQKLDAEIIAQEKAYSVEIGFWHVRREHNTIADALAKKAARLAAPVLG